MAKTTQQDEKSLVWYLKAPVRAILRMRDSYERGMNRAARGGVIGRYPTSGGGGSRGSHHSLHSSRRSSGEEDQWDLIRASSQKKLASTIVPRSQSAPGIGRIDEEEEEDFDGDVTLGVGMRAAAYPRSKSVAVPVKNSEFGV